MKVGYFAIPYDSRDSFINFDILKKQETVEELKYARHIRFTAPLTILMDGKKQTAVILYGENE